MARKKVRKLSKKEEKALKKNPAVETRGDSFGNSNKEVIIKEDIEKKLVEIPKIITVREFSEKLGMPPTKVISELMKNGIMASINESIDLDTAAVIGDELGFEIKLSEIKSEKKKELTEDEKKLQKLRPPIVVVMGHVDHGKTTLLDAIRKTNVVANESGGITQHIGAYQVLWKGKSENERLITFLDTPGHEAFSQMRAHGANITDIAILVVAADDGVKPQTKEAISHAKAANVPIVVAINKIDKPEADPDKVKRELSDLDLVPEEWGGKTIMVPISAKTGKNIDELLDIVLVVSDIENLTANPDRPAEGVVIESNMQSGVGPVATVLVKEGTLRLGQVVLVGSTFGRVRTLEDYKGKKINYAGPSTPVRIAGLHEVPRSGELFKVMPNEKSARNIIATSAKSFVKFGLAEVSEEARKGTLKELNLILKADVQGSLEAIKNSLENLGNLEIKVKILSATVGNVTESDINMALASKALVLGFKVQLPVSVKRLADEKGVKITLYDIIYNLIDDISLALEGMLEPEITEELVGKLEVIKVFFSSKNNKIVGGKVIQGKLLNNLKAYIVRNDEKIGEGKITSLKLEQNPVQEVLKGFECGLGIDTSANVKPSDKIEVYEVVEKIKKLK
jgi:translation initiation factor IF-2